MERRWRWSWFDQDILHEFWRWEECPFQIRFHHPTNVSVESLEGSRILQPPFVPHPKQSPPTPLLPCNGLWPSCFRHHSDLQSHMLWWLSHSWHVWECKHWLKYFNGCLSRKEVIHIQAWRASLTVDEVVRSKKLPKWGRSYWIHRTRFQVNQDGARNIFAT